VVIVTIRGDSLLFDPQPKSNRDDLYDREEELKQLQLSEEPIVLILAPRRFGKTSLLKVFLSETDRPSVFFDCRSISVNTAKEDFLLSFVRQVGKLVETYSSFMNFLRRIRGLKVFGMEIALADERKPDPVEVLEKLDDWAERQEKKLVLAFDEVQFLRFLRKAGGIDLPRLLAYAYDNLKNLQFIMTGSEVGILEDFLALENPNSPLYGRYVREIHVPRLTPEQSKDFLIKGFAQYGLKVPEDAIEAAVRRLDGIIGWLVHFGKRTLDLGAPNERILEQIVQEAKQAVLQELEKIFQLSERYRHVLRAVALGLHTWNDIKEAVEMKERMKLTDTSFNRIISKLVKMGYLEVERGEKNQYFIIDPVVREAMID